MIPSAQLIYQSRLTAITLRNLAKLAGNREYDVLTLIETLQLHARDLDAAVDAFKSEQNCEHCAAGALRIRRNGKLQHLAIISGTPAWWDCNNPESETDMVPESEIEISRRML